MEEKCVICGKTIPKNSQVCIVCGTKKSKKQKQIDYIKQKILNMTVDEVVEYIYHHEDVLLDRICIKKTISIGEPCPYNEIEDKKCCKCIKEWLEGEANE